MIAPAADKDMFDGARHPMPFVPPAAPAGSAGKSVAVEVHIDARGRAQKALVARSSGSPLLDEAARSWAQYIWRYSPSDAPRAERHILTFQYADEREDVRVARSIIPDTPRPPYPYLARRLRKQGAVDLLLQLAPDGSVQQARVTRSTGFPLLDLVAREWARSYWRLAASSSRKIRARVVFSVK